MLNPSDFMRYNALLFGLIIAILDVIPMLIQHMDMSANLSAFFHWIIVAFFISTTNIKLKAIYKGIFISIISLIPIAFLVWPKDFSAILPMSISTIVFGALLGFLIERYK